MKMAAPRKVFRIEQTVAARLTRRTDVTSASPQRPPAPASPDLPSEAAGTAGAALAADLTRIAHELHAVSSGTAQATQKILTAAEEIDQLADNLSAALKGRIEQNLAQDISDHVLRIFEACNFQDLIGQRVGKVMKTLTSDPLPLAADEAAPDLHGPRLDHDDGHMTQSEIDALFGD